MRFMLLIGASLALLVLCAAAPVEEDVIQHIPPKPEPTPSAIGKDGVKSGAAENDAGASKVAERDRRDTAGQESDLLPSGSGVDGSPFGESSQITGFGRIKVLPAYLG